MIGRLKIGFTAIAAALVVAPMLLAGELAAQVGGRYRVVIPDLFAAEGSDNGWGEDVAEELREIFNTLPRHAPVDRDDIRDQLRRNDLDMEDLTCLRTIQLGSLLQAELVLCVNYAEQANDQVAVDSIKFIDVASQQQFVVEPFTVHKDEKEAAAQRIVDAFDIYVQQLNFRTFCIDYAQNGDFEASLRQCDQSLELAPTDAVVMYQRAFTLRELDRPDEALDQLEDLLEVDPYHSDGLQLAGFLATTTGNEEQGREYYSRYLELNPGAIDVRRNIAYRLAVDAGDPLGGMLLIEEGLTADTPPEMAVHLQSDLGSYAFTAARQAIEGQPADAELTPEVEELFRTAIGAFEAVYEAQPDSMSVGQLRNVVLAYMNLDELQQAEQFANRILETHPEEATLWSAYATVLERQEKFVEAQEALAEIESIDPDYQNLYVRQGQLMLRAGRRDAALPIFQEAVQRGQDPNRVAEVIFADAHSKGFNDQNPNMDLQYGIAGVEMAKQFEVSAENKAKYDFWHGYGLLQRAIPLQEPSNVESARQTLPLFQESLRLLQASRSYAESTSGIPLDQLIDAATQYVDIQEAIIERGR